MSMNNKSTGIGLEDMGDLLVDKNGETSLAKLARWMYTVEDRLSMSLPAYLKRAIIESRTYITREAAVEECINNVLYSINVMYAGWCMTALSLNQMVNGSKVRDILQTVATEGLDNTRNDIYRRMDDIFSGIESFRKRITPYMASPIIPGIQDDSEDSDFAGTNGTRPIEFPKNYRLTEGIVLDVSFSVGDERSRKTVSVPIAVRLHPTVINGDAAKQFFAANFKMDTWMRFFKVKTGEISFFKDFIFELDLMKERTNAIKNDKTGTVAEMYRARDNALSSYLLKLIGWRADRQNIASAIHVFTKYQFDDFCRATHCNFENVNDRLKYFRTTLSMIVAVIDNEYQNVDMYFAGVGNKARYQFSQLENFTKPNQFDLTSVMRAFSNTTAPRF